MERGEVEERKGFQDWGLLIKVGSVDPLMKVQARGLLRSFYSDGSAGWWARKRAAKSVPWGEEEGRGVVRSGAVQEALIHPRVMPLTVKEDIQQPCIFGSPLSLSFSLPPSFAFASVCARKKGRRNKCQN